jgi:hypothetical protein
MLNMFEFNTCQYLQHVQIQQISNKIGEIYRKKIRMADLVMKNKIDMSYSEILYILE